MPKEKTTNKELKLFRVGNGLTQKQIAEKVGCDRSTYVAIENGQRKGSVIFWAKFKKAFPSADVRGLMKIDED
jgi:DNA-binding XRE family transcriptional regulator